MVRAKAKTMSTISIASYYEGKKLTGTEHGMQIGGPLLFCMQPGCGYRAVEFLIPCNTNINRTRAQGLDFVGKPKR